MSKNDEKMITRRVVVGRKYDIYGGDDVTKIKLLETIDGDKPNEAELKVKHKVKIIIVNAIAIKKALYGVPVDEFMKIAKVVKEYDEALTKENKENEENK